MPLPVDCCSSCCSTAAPVNVIGSTGADGAVGADGASAFTTLTTTLVIPAAAGPVVAPATITVLDASWIAIGQTIFASDDTDWGTFSVTNVVGNNLTLEYLAAPGDIGGGTIDIGGNVTPSGRPGALAAALPAAEVYTDLTTILAVDAGDLQPGVGMAQFTHPIVSIIGTAGYGALAMDVLTNFTVGYRFRLVDFYWVTTIVGAGAGASQTFNLEIGATNVTGGVLNVTLANTAIIGGVVGATAITAANIGSAADTISIEMAAGGTVFTSGSGYFVILIQNMDTADMACILSSKINDLITALT